MKIVTAHDFGKLIKNTRKKTKLTQNQALLVAKMLGIKFDAQLPPIE
jgi:hypothetical protein